MNGKDLAVVELSGIDYASERLRGFGAEVQERSRANKEYDLSVALPGGRRVRVEVKATDAGQAKPRWLV
jgi:hypothetical protein